MIQKRVIVFSTAFFPLVGGAEVALKEIMARLTSIHFDVVCAKIQPGLKSTEQFAENVTIHRVGVGSKVDKFLLPFLGSIRAARLEGSHDAVIWSLMASFGGFAALVYCAFRRNAKMLLTLQEGDPLEHYAKRAGAFRFLHKMIFRRANAVQAISTFLAKWATEMGFNGTPVVVPNGAESASVGKAVVALMRRSPA